MNHVDCGHMVRNTLVFLNYLTPNNSKTRSQALAYLVTAVRSSNCIVRIDIVRGMEATYCKPRVQQNHKSETKYHAQLQAIVLSCSRRQHHRDQHPIVDSYFVGQGGVPPKPPEEKARVTSRQPSTPSQASTILPIPNPLNKSYERSLIRSFSGIP